MIFLLDPIRKSHSIRSIVTIEVKSPAATKYHHKGTSIPHFEVPFRLGKHPKSSTNRKSSITGWWFQPLWTVLVNGKDYPIYYGKKNVWNHQPDYDYSHDTIVIWCYMIVNCSIIISYPTFSSIMFPILNMTYYHITIKYPLYIPHL